ncbi:MAG TPA: alkaline phosphatase PhoX [Allocoleopsis sp.]
MTFSRRKFLALAGTSAMAVGTLSSLQLLYSQSDRTSAQTVGFGALQKDPKGILDLPPGWQYKILSPVGEKMTDGNLVPDNHDGMGAFRGPNNTTILIRNHELRPSSNTRVIASNNQYYDPQCKGGTTTLIIGSDRQLIKHYTSLAGTYRNCGGGTTPWGTWISSEENTSTPVNDKSVSKYHGYNFEVPINATKAVKPEPLIAMGRFNHEAIAVDPKTGIIYQTEDREDGLFYRFIPKRKGKLKLGGVLQALRIKNKPKMITAKNFPVGQKMPVEWITIKDVNPEGDTMRIEGFYQGAAQFSRGEGMCYHQSSIYFTCTSGGIEPYGQIWRYIPGKNVSDGGMIELFVEPNNPEILDYPDNIIIAQNGDLMICEDGKDDQYIVGVTPEGKLYQFAKNALNKSEFAGICYAPDGKTMFVNIYNPGMTLAVFKT